MPLIALTGGIASGKSTIARRLAEHGAVIVDADAIVRDVQQPGSPVLERIAAAFGGEMLTADGALDRAALGGVVFGDPDALARLNGIVHPAVREESARRFAAAFAADPAPGHRGWADIQGADHRPRLPRPGRRVLCRRPRYRSVRVLTAPSRSRAAG